MESKKEVQGLSFTLKVNQEATEGPKLLELVTQVVGFESPTNELVSLLVGGADERTFVSVVGMGGLGKTTLANHVFDKQLVKRHFDYRSFITVSQSYTMRELLIEMQEGVGCLKSLQKLYFLEADHGGIDLIQKLKMLTQLRKLGIRYMRREYGNALCAAIQEMNHLESLNITAIVKDEILDLDFISTPPDLRVLNLKGRLKNLPDWIPNLKYLVKLRFGLSNLTNDPLDSLKNLPSLLRLNLWDDAFSGESLHFQVEGFPKLRELDLTRLSKLSSITIENGALLCLDHIIFNNNPELKVVPQDLKHLKNLRFLGFSDMPHELVESIDPEKDGQCHWIINHIPRVLIRQKVGSGFYDYVLHRIPTTLNV